MTNNEKNCISATNKEQNEKLNEAIVTFLKTFKRTHREKPFYTDRQ